MKNVLVFPCGSEIGLEINRALAHSKHFKLIGATSAVDHGSYVYQHHVANMPFVDSLDFIDRLNNIIKSYEIDFIIPAHDAVVVKLAENLDTINSEVICSPVNTCRICRSKSRTYETFRSYLQTPIIYDPSLPIPFPIFVKPDVGQGSKGTHFVRSQDELNMYLQNDPSLIVLEYLPGKEYTIDCFTDKHGQLLFAEGRERIRIVNGISVHSRPHADVRFQELARIINANISLRGVWFFQIKQRANGDFVLLEIAPRIAGTMALFRARGVNLVELCLFDRIVENVKPLNNHFDLEIDRALFGRYTVNIRYRYVYIDFDDTIVVNNSVNTTAMMYLYQCKNKKVNIILLTKHSKDIVQSLRHYSISDRLFDQIIVISSHEEKCHHIAHSDSIFIDDSFAERKKVQDYCGVPVFSVDAIETLLCWRA